MKLTQVIFTAFYDEVAIQLVQKEHAGNSNHIFIRSRSDMWRFLERYFNRNDQADVMLAGNSLEEMKNDFVSWFELVEAAGGVVKNRTEEYLLINRFGTWDLPKGKIKIGEKPETGAKREVTEETGVDQLDVIKNLPTTWHIYLEDEQLVLKKTQWFLMKTDFDGEPEPQSEEDIDEVTWMERREAITALNNSYRSLREILVPHL